jgi:plasmid maintenance system antidote protein VapI
MKPISDQIRAAILTADVSRYQIAKDCDISQANLSRFVHGQAGLSLAAIDRLGLYLKLRITKGK